MPDNAADADFEFISFDRSYVRAFYGFVSNRKILASAHPTRLVILRDVDACEEESLIEQYELISFERAEQGFIDVTPTANPVRVTDGTSCGFPAPRAPTAGDTRHAPCPA